MRENYAEVTISFETLIVLNTNVRAKYEIFSASSAMGGILGMLLGGSMMTLYELAEILFFAIQCFIVDAFSKIRKSFKISSKVYPN